MLLIAGLIIATHHMLQVDHVRSEERRVGKSVDLGGRRITKKTKLQSHQEIIVSYIPTHTLVSTDQENASDIFSCVYLIYYIK